MRWCPVHLIKDTNAAEGFTALTRTEVPNGWQVEFRTSTPTYNSKNELTSIQDPLLRTVGLAYDLAGRITTQTLPDTRTIGYAYDANGNITGITPSDMRSTLLMVGARYLKTILKR